MDSKTLIKIIKKQGWYLVRVNGSHHHFKNDFNNKIITIPHPKKDISTGTLIAILKIAGVKY